MKRFNPRFSFPWFGLALLFLALTGCQILVPVIDGFKQMGVTEGDRKNLLKPQVQGFQGAIGGGDLDGALSYLHSDAPQLRQAVIDEIRRTKHKEKVVDSQIDMVIYADDANRADVEVLVKYFRVPYYVVNRRVEMGEWEFSLNDGWKLKARTVQELPEE